MSLNHASVPIPAEMKALLSLSGVRELPGAGAALAEVVAAGIAERFVWLLNEHGVAAFVQKNIADAGLKEVLPPTLYQGLRNQTFKSIARNSFIMSAMRDVAEVLSAAGMIPVLLKGTALELSVYRESGLRPMSDADILLPREQCMKAWRVLQSAGFRPLPFKSPLHRLIPLHIGKHLPPLIKGGFSLEIHHGLWWGIGTGVTLKMIEEALLISDFRSTISDVRFGKKIDCGTPYGSERGDGMGERNLKDQGSAFAKATADRAGHGENVKIPPGGLHFLYLVSHLVQHEKDGNSQLRQYNDLVAMIDHHGAEEVVDVALEHAAEVGMEEELRNKLGLLRMFMGVELPGKYQYEPSPEALNKFVSFLGNPKGNPVGDRRVIYRDTVKGIPGLHRKMIFVIGDIFAGFRFMKQRYGKSSVGGILPYYFLRMGKVLWLIKGRIKAYKGIKGVKGKA